MSVRKTQLKKDDENPDKVIGKFPEGKKKKKGQEPLPVCRTAPDPEHHRGADDNQPCDDFRSGE